MVPSADVRWKQRCSNFLNALKQFEEGIHVAPIDRLAQEGLILRFRYTFEPGWKCLQDVL